MRYGLVDFLLEKYLGREREIERKKERKIWSDLVHENFVYKSMSVNLTLIFIIRFNRL